MARTDNDTWDLARNAEAAATGIAAECALANRLANPPIEDPFAEQLTLAHDCPASLRRAGLNPTQPTAWGAERPPFLRPDAQDRVLDNFTALSAAESRLTSEHLPNIGQVSPQPDHDDAAWAFAAPPCVSATWKWSLVVESPTGPGGIR